MRRPNSDDALWTFETARFAVEFHAEPEDLDPADSFEFPEDIEFATSGDPEHWFGAAVYVRDKATGEIIGRDYLGACSYNSFLEFYTSHRGKDPENRNILAMKARNTVICHYFPDMVRQAIADARRSVARARSLGLREPAHG